MHRSNLSANLGEDCAFILAFICYTGLLFRSARKRAQLARKPLLNVGCKAVYTGLSDVNLDIVPRDVPNFTLGDVQDMGMFEDKQFAAAFASHVLEHVPDPEAALRELNRVADRVYIVTPLPIFPWTWLHPEHRWIIWGTRVWCKNPLYSQLNPLYCRVREKLGIG